MIATIEAKYTGEITREEVRETMLKIQAGHYALPTFAGALQGLDWLKSATPAQLDELLGYYAPILARDLKALDEANRFRPSYAPAGQLTKTQQETRLIAQQTTRIVRMLTFKRDARLAKAQAS